jgi:hypothetical protein
MYNEWTYLLTLSTPKPMANNLVTQRFMLCFEDLRKARKIKSARQFSLSLGCLAQNFSEMQHDRRDVTIDLVRRATEEYKFNPVFIFSGEGERFLSETPKTDLQILTIVTDADDNERIVHVPVPAQAGYAAEVYERVLEPTVQKKLETFMLPSLRYQRGTFRSFDVAGDSMEPSLYAADQVVGAYMEQDFWYSSLKPGLLCIFVLEKKVLVKRCAATPIKGDDVLILLSDNPAHLPITVKMSAIREIWRVTTRITAQTDLPKNDWNDLVAIIEAQTRTILELKNMLQKRL